MPDRSVTPQYRFRGSVQPSAEVSRPVAARRNAATAPGGTAAAAAPSSSATLDIFDVIDSYGGWWGISARDVDAALASIGDVDTLYVRVNSPGGEGSEGVAIANLLRAHRADVHVSVIGLAASAASYIATAGDVVTMAPGAMMMVHDAWLLTIGNADDLRSDADSLDALSDSIASLYALKAGGTVADWRAVMRTEKWYTADAAVEAKLADAVGLDPAPSPVPAEDPDEMADDELDAPLARAAARFDMSMFAHAPAALVTSAPTAPAASADGSTTHERSAAVAFTDEQLTTMRQQLGLPADADETAIVAALPEALAERADAPAPDPAPAPAAALPDGHVAIPAAALDELRIAAQAGQQARAEQLRSARDEAINTAVREGRIAPARSAHWTSQWDADPEGTRTVLAALEPVHPVGPIPGYAGSGGQDSVKAAFTDDEADALGALAGLPKGVLR